MTETLLSDMTRKFGVLGKVPAVDIVHEAVVVVVYPVAGRLARVCPDGALQVRMGQVDSGIQVGDHHLRPSGRVFPRGGICIRPR